MRRGIYGADASGMSRGVERVVRLARDRVACCMVEQEPLCVSFIDVSIDVAMT